MEKGRSRGTPLSTASLRYCNMFCKSLQIMKCLHGQFHETPALEAARMPMDVPISRLLSDLPLAADPMPSSAPDHGRSVRWQAALRTVLPDDSLNRRLADLFGGPADSFDEQVRGLPGPRVGVSVSAVSRLAPVRPVDSVDESTRRPTRSRYGSSPRAMNRTASDRSIEPTC